MLSTETRLLGIILTTLHQHLKQTLVPSVYVPEKFIVDHTKDRKYVKSQADLGYDNLIKS
jgi:hypothetical protein